MSDTTLSDSNLAAMCNKAQKLWAIGRKVQFLLPYHQHPPLILWNDIIKIRHLLLKQPSYKCNTPALVVGWKKYLGNDSD